MASEPSTPSEARESTRNNAANRVSELMLVRTAKTKPRRVMALGEILNFSNNFAVLNEMVNQPFTIPEIFAPPCKWLQV
jgi:hypothetical protein